jgi:hypothetical protein
MKKLILIISLILGCIFTQAQSLKMYFHSSQIQSRDSSQNYQAAWTPYGSTNARFYIYTDGVKYTKVVTYFSPKDNFTVPTTFYVYDQKQAQEDNGIAYYLYVYYGEESGTSKTYDHTEYIKVKDQIKENISSLQLFGYQNSTIWAWIIDVVTKY